MERGNPKQLRDECQRGGGNNPMQSRNPMQPHERGERCGARKRDGTPCRTRPMPNGRCRMHGGKAGRPPTTGRRSALPLEEVHANAAAEGDLRRRLTAPGDEQDEIIRPPLEAASVRQRRPKHFGNDDQRKGVCKGLHEVYGPSDLVDTSGFLGLATWR